MRLGLSLPILPQETLPSFVSHVAQKNGSRHVQDFVLDMDLSWRRILQLDPDTVQELADLTGTDTERLAKNSFAPIGDSSFRLQGSNLPRSFLDRSALKFCPICIKADQDNHGRTWGRALWQIDSLHVCPDHGVLLGALVPPDYPRCPHDFAGRVADCRALVNEVAVEVGAEAIRYARMLSDRLQDPYQSERRSWLYDLPIDVAARLSARIDADAAVLISTGGGKIFGEMVRQSIMEEMERHAVPEDHWPPVDRIFEQVRANPESDELWAGSSFRLPRIRNAAKPRPIWKPAPTGNMPNWSAASSCARWRLPSMKAGR